MTLVVSGRAGALAWAVLRQGWLWAVECGTLPTLIFVEKAGTLDERPHKVTKCPLLNTPSSRCLPGRTILHSISYNRQYDLARQSRRLTPWRALFTLNRFMLLVSQVISLPLLLFIFARNGIAGGEGAAVLADQPTALSGLLQGSLLALTFGSIILPRVALAAVLRAARLLHFGVVS